MLKIITTIIGSILNAMAYVTPKLCGKISFHIFCTPMKAPLKAKHHEFLKTAAQKQISINGQNIMTYTWGRGPTKVLLVHGWRSNSYRWKNLIKHLDQDLFTLIAIDAPGHGNSDGRISNVPLFQRALIAAYTKMGPIDIIIGHSLGSFASAYFLFDHPHQVSKFVSLATPYTAESFVDYYQTLLKLSDRTMRLTTEYFEAYAGRPVSFFNMSNFCTNLDISTLIIHDKNDKDTSVESSIKLHEVLSHSQLVLTENLGHNLRGKEVIEAIDNFAKSSN